MIDSNSFWTSWVAAAFVKIGRWEDNPLHEEATADEGWSLSHHPYHVVVGLGVQGNELMLRPLADIAYFVACQQQLP